jgi:hypothetical protein
MYLLKKLWDFVKMIFFIKNTVFLSKTSIQHYYIEIKTIRLLFVYFEQNTNCVLCYELNNGKKHN